jgi:sec-independent protein translocase protein TatA
MFGLGAGEVLLIAVIALVFIGPKKLPELAQSLGRALREFQKAKNQMTDEFKSSASEGQTPSQISVDKTPLVAEKKSEDVLSKTSHVPEE